MNFNEGTNVIWILFIKLFLVFERKFILLQNILTMNTQKKFLWNTRILQNCIKIDLFEGFFLHLYSDCNC